jgi:two-component system, LytTR family, response regulator
MNALIVDDEYSNRTLLASMLKRHCPEVTILGDAENADIAHELILKLKPDLVFLDIKMPQKNGFDLLRMFDEINFSVIFVTGFDEYAIQAFEFNAIDYILKPIDYSKLITAVKKVSAKLKSNGSEVIHFVHSLAEKTNFIKKITLHGKDKVHVIDLEDIVYVSADRGYCELLDASQQRHVSAKTLAEYEELLQPFKNFIRVNKSYIINIKHLKSYTKGTDCIISMNGCTEEIEVSRRKKAEINALIKE